MDVQGAGEHHALLDSLDAVIIVENEAESMPVHDENKSVGGVSSGLNLLDHCPVCHLNFHSREPKLLPCLHSFCKKCLPSPSRNLAMVDPPPNSHQLDGSITKPLNVIRCPVCRQECMEVDVMENFFVKDTVETPSSTVERTIQLCMTCDDNTEATGFCAECMEYMCVTCVDAHQRVKFTKDHTIRHKEEVLQEAHGASTKRPVFCDLHKQEPLKLFCETCDLLTCRDCQLVKHKDHNYQFLADAYNNHKQRMESMTRQLQEKKRVIEEVSSSINNGLNQVDENRTTVHSEIKKAICNLILEINKKGKILVNQLEAVTKDHEGVLRKQQQDIGYLSRHMDHVISFTQWATARTGSTALLYCKRLILFQIGNLLRAKCSASFVPQSSVRFQCRSSYWASNIDLGSLVVETVPGHQLGAFQGIPHQLSHPGGLGPSSSPSGGLGAPGPLHHHLGSHNTLAQLQMQVDKLNPQPHWQPPQPPAPSWTWPWSVRLPRSAPPGAGGPVQGGSPSQSSVAPGGMAPMAAQPGGRKFMVPPPNHVSPTGRLPSPGFTPQSVQPPRSVGSSPSHQRGLGSSPSHHPKPVDIFSTSHLYATHNASLPSNGGVSSPHSRQLASALIQDFSNFVMSRTPKIDMYFGQGQPPSERTLGSPEEKMEASYLNKRSDPGGTVQMLRPSYPQGLASSIPHRNAQAQQSSPGYPAVSQEEKPGTVHWKPPDPQQQQHSGSVASSSAAKRRRRSSPGPVIVIKDEPEDDVSYVQTNQRANLPDSTGDRPQTSSQPGGKRVTTPPHRTENKPPQTPPQQAKTPVLTQGERSEADTPNRTSGMLGRETAGDGGRGGGPTEDTNEDVCAVCMSGGQLLCCGHCPKVFHLACHVPSLSTCPSGEWWCSLCRDVAVPEMEYDCGKQPEARAVKEEPDCERGLPPLDKRKCERLLLRLFCSERSSDFHQPALPSGLNESGQSVTTPPPMDVSIVKNRLEAKLSPCYQRPAHFISDLRLRFRNCALLHEADSKVAVAGRELEQQFEEELKVLYPGQTFSQVKMEVGNVPASPLPPTAVRGHPADPQTPAPNADCQTPLPNAGTYTPAPNADPYTPAPNANRQTPTAPNAEAQTPAVAPNTPQGEEQGDAAASMRSHTQQHCL